VVAVRAKKKLIAVDSDANPIRKSELAAWVKLCSHHHLEWWETKNKTPKAKEKAQRHCMARQRPTDNKKTLIYWEGTPLDPWHQRRARGPTPVGSGGTGGCKRGQSDSIRPLRFEVWLILSDVSARDIIWCYWCVV
jgi:hypothetical protein